MDASIFDMNNFLFVFNIGRMSPVFCWWRVFYRFTYVISSFEEQTVDALASGAEEGRSNLR